MQVIITVLKRFGKFLTIGYAAFLVVLPGATLMKCVAPGKFVGIQKENAEMYPAFSKNYQQVDPAKWLPTAPKEERLTRAQLA